MDKPVLKKFDGIEYWDYGTSDTVFIFLHGNVAGANSQNVLGQGPLSYDYQKLLSTGTMILTDPSEHNVRVIVPVNTDVGDGYQDDRLVERLMKDPNISRAKKFVLSGNSFGGKEVCRQIVEGEIEFDAYVIFSPYYPPVPAAVKHKKPTLIISGNEDPTSKLAPVEAYFNAILKLGVPAEKIWLSRKDHFASGAVLGNTKNAKTMVYDWIDLKVKPNSEPEPALPQVDGDIYEMLGRYWVNLKDGRKAQVVI